MQAVAGTCTPDVACAPASPNALQFGGAMNQCNKDNQCPSATPDVGSHPSSPYCCDEVRAFYSDYSNYCTGSDASRIVTMSGCADKLNCASQPTSPIPTVTNTTRPTPPWPGPQDFDPT